MEVTQIVAQYGVSTNLKDILRATNEPRRALVNVAGCALGAPLIDSTLDKLVKFLLYHRSHR